LHIIPSQVLQPRPKRAVFHIHTDLRPSDNLFLKNRLFFELIGQFCEICLQNMVQDSTMFQQCGVIMEEVRLLTKDDIDGLREVIENDEMVFDRSHLSAYLEKGGTYLFGWIADGKTVGLLYGYDLLRLDGRRMFYMHSVDLLPGYQNRGRGSKLVQFAVDYARRDGFSEVFVITNKSNQRACKVYEKAGGKNDMSNDIVYVMDFKK
jgi:ribosomal protein S18 acetylase RimI-like enzyme